MRTFICTAIIWSTNWLEVYTGVEYNYLGSTDMYMQGVGMLLCLLQDIRGLFKK